MVSAFWRIVFAGTCEQAEWLASLFMYKCVPFVQGFFARANSVTKEKNLISYREQRVRGWGLDVKNPAHMDMNELSARLTLIANLNGSLKVVHEENSSIIEIRPSPDKPKVISHDDLLAIVELVKEHEKLLMDITADSEPIIRIYRKGLIL